MAIATVLDALADAFVAEGVTVAANLPDDVTIFIAEALRGRGVRIVRPRHEQNAVLVADGYARASGGLGVCVIGPGPGIAQTGTALVTAARRRSPVLVVVAERSAKRGDGKELDIRRFVESTGARYLDVRSPQTLAEDLHEAFRQVRLRRGPVAVNLSDVRMLDAPVPSPWAYIPTAEVQRPGLELDPDSPTLDAVAGLLAWSRRPVIFAGHGAKAPGVREDVIVLAERTGALLASSMQARNLFAGHPRDIGILGNFASDAATELLAEADCVLALGVSLNPHQIGFAPSTRLIQVDHEATRIGEYAMPSIPVVADVGATVRAVNRLLDVADVGEPDQWRDERHRPLIAAAPQPPAVPEQEPAATLGVSVALAQLDALLPPDRFAIVDAGYYVPFVFDRIALPNADSWIWSLDFASVGLGLGLAIGASVARPERPCVLFVGDGGLSMSLQELETVVREAIPLTIVVLNDGAYSAELRHLEGRPKDLALFRDVDFAAVMRALGGDAVTLRALADVPDVAAHLRDRRGPLLIDAKVVENESHRLFRAR
jgi:acetolactate synthase-1/2/3 large subunit